MREKFNSISNNRTLITDNECTGKTSKHKIRISDFVTCREVL